MKTSEAALIAVVILVMSTALGFMAGYSEGKEDGQKELVIRSYEGPGLEVRTTSCQSESSIERFLEGSE